MNKIWSLLLAVTLVISGSCAAVAQDFDKGLKAAQAAD
jgi:hypothetical protein